MNENENITRIEIFCDDRMVGKIHRLLLGVGGIFDFKSTPVKNAVVKPGKKGVQAKNDGSLISAVAEWLKTKQGQTIRVKDLKEFLTASNLSPLSYSYAIAKARSAKLIKPAKTKGHYEVLA